MAKRRRTPEAPPLFEVEPAQAGQPSGPPAANESKDFVDQFMYLLTAPYMFYPPWDDIWSYQDRKSDALMHRLIQGQEIWETKQCSEYEAMIYISTATLSAPPSHDWYCIYAWLFRRWRPEQGAEVFDGHDGEKLNANQKEDLARLRSWIFKTQMNHMKAKRAKTAKEVQEVEAEEQQLQVEHPRLF